MPRVETGSIAAMRAIISFAALLVNVTARMPAGLTVPVWISQAMRVVSTRVLPDARAGEDQRVLRRKRDGLELLGVEVLEEAGHSRTAETAAAIL